MKRLILTATALTALGLSLAGCASTGGSLSLAFAPSKRPAYFPNMSAGTGPVIDCGQFKYSDPACNPAMSVGGGGF